MRIFVLFALTLTGTAVITDDASAIGRRKRGGSSGCGQPVMQTSCCGGGMGYGYGSTGMYGGSSQYGSYGMVSGAGYGVASGSCCGGSMAYPGSTMTYPGGYSSGIAGSTTNSNGQNTSGKQQVIQATDGKVYTLGSDGSYYPAGTGVSTLGGFTTQPYTGGYNGGYRSFYYPSNGIYQAGYPGSYYNGYNGYNGVYPAGGTSPLTMPGINLPGGLRIVPNVMPNK
jgi:hypothetical protein